MVFFVAALCVGGASATTASNSQTFIDAAYDNPGDSPDVTSVTVSNDDDGVVEFRLQIRNRTEIREGDFLAVNLDTDQSAATGCDVGGGMGVDWAIAYVGHSEPAPDFYSLLRYPNCSTADPNVPETTLAASFASASTTLVIRANRAEIAGASAFRFFVHSTVAPVGPETSDLAGELAPWIYQVIITPPTDRMPPTVKALPGIAVRGKVATLRYSVFDESGQAREEVTVQRGRRVLATRKTVLGSRGATAIRTATWRVPKRAAGPLRFCVQAWDAAGNRSASSCARLTLR